MSQNSLLVTHPWIGNGGSEATAMWVLRALQDDFEVNLVSASPVDFNKLNKIYEAQVDPKKIKLIQAPRIPLVKRGDQLVALQHAVFQRYCRRIANQFELCISSYNFVDFGKPGIQLVGDLSFNEHLRKEFYVLGDERFRHRANLLRKSYLGIKKCINPEKIPYHRRGDMVLANSQWTASQLEKHCALKDVDVLYPPVSSSLLTGEAEVKRNPFGFCYIGRIVPEKEIVDIITILDWVRAMGYPVELDLAGNTHQSSYEKKITEMASARSWINDLGYLAGDEKRATLYRNSFGIQACRCESFGIATAELALGGCLPFVPVNCGPAEIVPFPELQFHSRDDAIDKIIHLLELPSKCRHLRLQAAQQIERFSASEFVSVLRKHVEIMFQKTRNEYRSPHVTPEEGLSSHHRPGILSEDKPGPGTPLPGFPRPARTPRPRKTKLENRGLRGGAPRR